MQCHMIFMVILGLSLGLYRSGLSGRRVGGLNSRSGLGSSGLGSSSWTSKIAKSKKLGRLGDLSLKSTLSILSMSAAMVLFSQIEQSLQYNGDVEGLEWLKREKQSYFNNLSIMDPWMSKPWTISGSIICILILFSTGSLGLCHCRNRRMRIQEREERRHGNDDDGCHRESHMLKEFQPNKETVEETKTVTKSEMITEASPKPSTGIQFGEVYNVIFVAIYLPS